MNDAMQSPQPMDEHGGGLADSLLESPVECGEGGLGSATMEPAETHSQVPSEAAAEAAKVETATEIEFEWEEEVNAFVKAEAEAAAATHASEAARENPATPMEEPSQEINGGAGLSGQESSEFADGLDAACQCFAGSIGASENSSAEETKEHDTCCSLRQEGLLQAELLPNEEVSATEAADFPETAAEADSLPQAEIETASDATIEAAAEPAPAAEAPQPREERRKRRRAMISAPVRVRGVNVTKGGPDEISTTIDVSRNGILFTAAASAYYRGMEVAVIFPYSTAPTAIHAEQTGFVVRVQEMADGRTAVAIALGVGAGDDLVDACGRKLTSGPAHEIAAGPAKPLADRPLILAMDPDMQVRSSLRAFLEAEGYQVIVVASIGDARQVLEMCVPALVIAEVEGSGIREEGLPGFDLCAHIKESRRLKRVPVVLTTQSAYPSDYSNAHSLGAIVCMAKPYKQERLGHVVRLLAPLQAHKEAPATSGCKPDPKRKACATPHAGAGRAPVVKRNYDENTNTRRKYRFPSFR